MCAESKKAAWATNGEGISMPSQEQNICMFKRNVENIYAVFYVLFIGVLEGIRTPDPLVRRGIQHVLFVVIKCCFALFKTEANGCIQAKFNGLCLPVLVKYNQCYCFKKFILLENYQKVRQHF